MKKINLLLIGFICLFLNSCASYTIASYSVGLQSVESPVDAKKQFGETKIVNFTEGDQTKYRYEDDFIEIAWLVLPTKFHFTLKNKTGHTIKINWDDISYVDINGQTSKVMHSGIKYTDRNQSQASTTVPKEASITDVLIPTNNVFFNGSWQESLLIPSIYKSEEAYKTEAPSYVGKNMKIMMPIMIENIQNDYSFEFKIEKLK